MRLIRFLVISVFWGLITLLPIQYFLLKSYDFNLLLGSDWNLFFNKVEAGFVSTSFYVIVGAGLFVWVIGSFIIYKLITIRIEESVSSGEEYSKGEVEVKYSYSDDEFRPSRRPAGLGRLAHPSEVGGDYLYKQSENKVIAENDGEREKPDVQKVEKQNKNEKVNVGKERANRDFNRRENEKSSVHKEPSVALEKNIPFAGEEGEDDVRDMSDSDKDEKRGGELDDDELLQIMNDTDGKEKHGEQKKAVSEKEGLEVTMDETDEEGETDEEDEDIYEEMDEKEKDVAKFLESKAYFILGAPQIEDVETSFVAITHNNILVGIVYKKSGEIVSHDFENDKGGEEYWYASDARDISPIYNMKKALKAVRELLNEVMPDNSFVAINNAVIVSDGEISNADEKIAKWGEAGISVYRYGKGKPMLLPDFKDEIVDQSNNPPSDTFKKFCSHMVDFFEEQAIYKFSKKVA